MCISEKRKRQLLNFDKAEFGIWRGEEMMMSHGRQLWWKIIAMEDKITPVGTGGSSEYGILGQARMPKYMISTKTLRWVCVRLKYADSAHPTDDGMPWEFTSGVEVEKMLQ